MIRLTYLIRRLPELSIAEFRDYWLNKHGPLVARYTDVFGIRRYVQTHTWHDDPLTSQMRAERGMRDEPVYGHAELWVDRHALAAASGPEVEAAFELFVEDCKLFIDLPASSFQMGKEYLLVDRPQVTRPIPTPCRTLW